MGHRVNTFLSEFFVVLTKGPRWPTPQVDPRPTYTTSPDANAGAGRIASYRHSELQPAGPPRSSREYTHAVSETAGPVWLWQEPEPAGESDRVEDGLVGRRCEVATWCRAGRPTSRGRPGPARIACCAESSLEPGAD
jgi:hypothetical protein